MYNLIILYRDAEWWEEDTCTCWGQEGQGHNRKSNEIPAGPFLILSMF